MNLRLSPMCFLARRRIVSVTPDAMQSRLMKCKKKSIKVEASAGTNLVRYPQSSGISNSLGLSCAAIGSGVQVV